MSCLWIYASNKVLRKRLCHCNVGPLEVLAKTSTALQFYFCDNEQDLLVCICYISNLLSGHHLYHISRFYSQM